MAAVSLKGANDEKSTNSIIARSMGMGKAKKNAVLSASNPGHNVAPPNASAKSKLPPMPTAEAVQMGLPSALAALKAHRDGPPPEDIPAPVIRSKTQAKEAEGSDVSDDDGDAELGLDDDDAVSLFREKRMAELKVAAAKQQQFKHLGHGSYAEIKEDEFLPAVTKSKYAVCHFYHSHFERCKIVDKHLALLSAEHIATKFVKLNAEKAPFFVEKLAIKVLPTVVLFKDGVAVDRVVGFEDFGGVDDFKTVTFAQRIAKKGIIVLKTEKSEAGASANASIRAATNNDSSDDEGDATAKGKKKVGGSTGVSKPAATAAAHAEDDD